MKLKIAEKYSIDDRIERLNEKQAYITVKDHKENFPHITSFLLINPSQSEIGKISKKILDNINKKIKSATHINQWRNTKEVIDWFQNINNKKNCTFITFDVKSFYPCISSNLFENTILFAKKYAAISDEERNIIMQSRKTFLFYDGSPWIKKGHNENFDIPMGCFDGAECCELVGAYILNLLGEFVDKGNIGLYRDDGFGVFENLSGPQIERK